MAHHRRLAFLGLRSACVALAMGAVTCGEAGEGARPRIASGSSGNISAPQEPAPGPEGGWYYDNPAMPTTIRLCPASCQALAGGRLQVEYGCETIVQPLT